MKLGHIHLKVRDIEKAIEFYSGLLGLKVTEQIGDSFVFLSAGSAHHDLALQRSRNVTQETSPLYHLAFECESLEELQGKLAQLRAPYSLVDHGISIAAYSSDPEGNGVELYVDMRFQAGGRALWRGQSRQFP